MPSFSASTKNGGSSKRRRRSRSSSSYHSKSIEKIAETNSHANHSPPSITMNRIENSKDESSDASNLDSRPPEKETLSSTPPSPSAPSRQDDEDQPKAYSVIDHRLPTRSGNQIQGMVDNPTHQMEHLNQRDKIQRVQIEPERTGWARLSDLLREKDKEKIEDIKEDIDTLLVFAGLFSAVVTAFIIESYKNLQQQPEEITAQVLVQISAQLASLTINGNFINSTVSHLTSPTFTSPKYTVQVNTLWSLSLVISLITASLAILVKQWFHEYMARDTSDPKKQVKIRFFRDAGMVKWRVLEIAALLPLLLQLALLLFFTGLGLFLHNLNSVVGWVTTGFMLVWFGAFIIATLAPAFSSQCPYKTPMLKGLLACFRTWWITSPCTIIDAIYSRIPQSWVATKAFFYSLWYLSRERKAKWEVFEEKNTSENVSLDLPVVVGAKDILQGEKLDETVDHCFRDRKVTDLVKGFQEFRQTSDRGLISWTPALHEDARGLFATMFIDSQCSVITVGEGCSIASFRDAYQVLTQELSESYVPGDFLETHLIPSPSLSAFIQLIQGDPTSATFAILTMYSIRHRTISQHPSKWNNLLPGLSEAEMQLYGIGDQFVSNLLMTTKALIHSLWNRQQPELGIQQIADCVAAIRNDAGQSDPAVTPDPIAFIYVFAIVLRVLTPEDVVQKHQERIFEVMGELAEILAELDPSSWSYSRKECAEWTSAHLYWCDLEDEQNLCPKLCTLIKTWNSDWCR